MSGRKRGWRTWLSHNPKRVPTFGGVNLWVAQCGSTLKMRTEPAPSQLGAKRCGKAWLDADHPHLHTGTRQFAVRLPPAVLPPGQRSNAIPNPVALASAGQTRSTEQDFGPEKAGLPPHRIGTRDGKGRGQMPVGTSAQPRFEGVCHWLINGYSDGDEIPASETAPRDGLITGLGG